MKFLKSRKNYAAGLRLYELANAPATSATTDKLKQLLSMKYPQFVRNLKGMADDPKLLTLIKAGMYDGNKDDERIVFPESSSVYPVLGLIPTQNEIDIDSSLLWQLNSTAEKSFGIDKILSGNAVTIKSPLVILNGKYILDGHHRWSQVYAMNKDAKIVCYDLRTKQANIDPQQVLKAIQLAIAAMTKDVPVAEVKGQNLLRTSEDVIVAYVAKGEHSMKPEFKGAQDYVVELVGKKDASVTDKASLAAYVWKNVAQMQQTNQPYKGANAPERGVMPQTDDVLDTTQFKTLLNSGAINFLEPVKRETDAPVSQQAAPNKEAVPA